MRKRKNEIERGIERDRLREKKGRKIEVGKRGRERERKGGKRRWENEKVREKERI